MDEQSLEPLCLKDVAIDKRRGRARPREQAVTDLTNEGKSRKEIAKILGVTVGAVRFHQCNLEKRKTGTYKPQYIPGVKGKALDAKIVEAKGLLFMAIGKLSADQIMLGFIALSEKSRKEFAYAARLYKEYCFYKEACIPDDQKNTENLL